MRFGPRSRTPALLALAVCLLLLGACGGGGGDSGSGNPGTLPPSSTPPTVNPPANEGGPVASTAFDYCLTKLNGIRSARGLTPFTRDGQLDTFALNAARQFLTDLIAHNYFATYNTSCGAPGFNTSCAENQGWAGGYGSDAANIDAMIDGMMDEEWMYAPGDSRRGHFETIVNPSLTRIGIGFVQRNDGTLFLSNDFSN